jgi:hypothetical protein
MPDPERGRRLVLASLLTILALTAGLASWPGPVRRLPSAMADPSSWRSAASWFGSDASGLAGYSCC